MASPWAHQISCATKDNIPGRENRVASIGFLLPDGAMRVLTQQEAIHGIRRSIWIFFAVIDGQQQMITIATDSEGNEFLTTIGDDGRSNGLLKLPGC